MQYDQNGYHFIYKMFFKWRTQDLEDSCSQFRQVSEIEFQENRCFRSVQKYIVFTDMRDAFVSEDHLKRCLDYCTYHVEEKEAKKLLGIGA